MKKQRVVVVGNGMVGHKFIENLVNHASASDFDIVTFAEESRLAYDRVQMSSYFSGATAADLALTTGEYYQEHGVTVRLNEKVTEINKAEKYVVSESGHKESYDKLILATGSYPLYRQFRCQSATLPDLPNH